MRGRHRDEDLGKENQKWKENYRTSNQLINNQKIGKGLNFFKKKKHIYGLCIQVVSVEPVTLIKPARVKSIWQKYPNQLHWFGSNCRVHWIGQNPWTPLASRPYLLSIHLCGTRIYR